MNDPRLRSSSSSLALNIAVATVYRDSVGDDFNSLQEYLADTDPTNAPSALIITAIRPSGANFIISFASVSGKTYELDWTDDLVSGTWNPVATNIAGTGGIVQVTDPGATALPQRFYRVLLRR